MGGFRCATDRMWSGGLTVRADHCRNPAASRSAVEKAEAGKPAKTKSRFPPLPTPPRESRRRREIPTFPPRRRPRFAWVSEKTRRLAPPKPKTQKRTDHVLIKADILTN